MYETSIDQQTLPGAYHAALYALHHKGQVTGTDYNQRQKELAMTMVVRNPFQEPMISRFGIFGPFDLQHYVMEICDGIMDFKIAANDTAWHYTYHSRMRKYELSSMKYLDQIQFVINDLKRNPDSRRAVIDVRDNRVDTKISSAACLNHMQFFIRDGKLDMMVLMRSNDAPEAAFMNAFAFIMLQKKIADELGLPVGTYTHRANSFHVYEKNFTMLENFVERTLTQIEPYDSYWGHPDFCYRYEGHWKELMEDEIPNINRKIEALKASSQQKMLFS
jgi:thymidylate synthase